MLKARITKRLQYWRMRAIFALFPHNLMHICANRVERTWRTDKMDITLATRDKRQPDAISDEEIMKAMDTYLGREMLNEEWKMIRAWKQNRHPTYYN